MRKQNKKVGESFHNETFNNKLKSQDQQQKFCEELESTLSMIIGVQGVQLNYVIPEYETSNFDATVTYEQANIQARVVDIFKV